MSPFLLHVALKDIVKGMTSFVVSVPNGTVTTMLFAASSMTAGIPEMPKVFIFASQGGGVKNLISAMPAWTSSLLKVPVT